MTTEKKIKIFLVDDEVMYLNMLNQHIRNLGYDDITLFDNGPECIDSLYENPDVIFVDYRMDTLSGYEVLKKIKRFNPNIYVVIISGQDQVSAAVDTLKHGAFDYIQKGDAEEDKIRTVLERIIAFSEYINRSKPNILKKIFQCI